MGVLEFLCDRRFHNLFVLPPDPEAGRTKPYRVSYSDYGDPNSTAVVLLCGALMGTRLSYSPLDPLAKAHNVRIIHADRPGIGGTDPVDVDQRVQIWLDVVPQLLAHLNIRHVSLASHSAGTIYLINTLLTYPQLLHPSNPYVCFFAPWVHPAHSKVMHMQAAELLPAPMIGKFSSVARFVNEKVMPLAGLSGSFVEGIKGSFMRPNGQPAPVSLAPTTNRSRETSISSRDGSYSLPLDDEATVQELRKLIMQYLFAESIDGVSADTQLVLKRPRSIPWSSQSIPWTDYNEVLPLVLRMINENRNQQDGSAERKWIVDAFHAETDDLVGDKGREWFDDCWNVAKLPIPSEDNSQPPSTSNFEFRTQIVKDSDHNYLMDPAFGASDLWLQRVREAFPTEVNSLCLKEVGDEKKTKFRLFLNKLSHMTHGVAIFKSLTPSILSSNMLIVRTRSGRDCAPEETNDQRSQRQSAQRKATR